MKILITGGAGYVGTVLVPRLLEDGHEVVVYDLCWYGNYLTAGMADSLALVQRDIRDTNQLAAAMKGCDAVIHLAAVSNDPSVELDVKLSEEINFTCFEPMIRAAKAAGVRRFINCSTSSVYGISDSPDVREDHPHVPLTAYNKFKSMCEPIAMSYQSDDFTVVTVRPSTICGYSPRMRLDLSVNILTNSAVNKGTITVRGGGKQMRPNLHIKDMVDVYLMLLYAPKENVAGQTFNAGAANYSIMDLATLVKQVVDTEFPNRVGVRIEVVDETVDKRSYQVNSDKIMSTFAWHPRFTVQDAVRDLCDAFKAGLLPDSLTDPRYYNVKSMLDLYNKGVLSEIDLHRGVKA